MAKQDLLGGFLSVCLACGGLLTTFACTSDDTDDTDEPEAGGAAGGTSTESGGTSGSTSTSGGGTGGATGGSTGGGTGGATGGSGGSTGGAAGVSEACPADAVAVSEVLIDDFEDGDIESIPDNDGRKGGWYTFTDETLDAAELTIEALDGEGYGGSGYAIKLASDGGYVTWGVGMGTDFYPVDGACAYDASVFAGLNVCLKGTADLQVYLQLAVPGAIPTTSGGLCEDPDQKNLCHNSPATPLITLTADWECHEFEWADFTPPNWGGDYEWDASAIAKFELRVDQNNATDAFAVYMDNVQFIETAGGGEGGAGGVGAGGADAGGADAGGANAGGADAGGAGGAEAGGSGPGGSAGKAGGAAGSTA